VVLGDKMTMNTAIKNDQEYEIALEAIEQLLEADPGSPDGDTFEVLAKMIEEYDDIHHRFNE
jgi:HTH-type transcriptional regulator/antitoxin HigA